MADLTPVSEQPHPPITAEDPSTHSIPNDTSCHDDETTPSLPEEGETVDFESDELDDFEVVDLVDEHHVTFEVGGPGNFELSKPIKFAMGRPVNYEDPHPLNTQYHLPIEDSTTEDQETLPGESTTTTDAGGYHDDQVVNRVGGASGRVTDTRYQAEAVLISSSRVVGGVHSYENWPLMLGLGGDESGKRKRSITRMKGSRAPLVRPRPPQPLPRLMSCMHLTIYTLQCIGS